MDKTDFFKISLILIMAGTVLSVGLTKKFIGHHDWNSAMYSTIARNYYRYGLWDTRGGQVENPDIVLDKSFSYKTHYPPLLPIFISFCFRLLGVSEFSSRLVPYISSLLLLVLIYFIAKRLSGSDVAILSCLLILVSPLFLYFGTSPVHETVVPTFSMLAFLGYLHYFRYASRFSYSIMLIGVILGGLTNWTGYYIVPPIVLHFLLLKKPVTQRIGILLLIPFCIGLFLLHLVHIYWLTGGYGKLGGIFLDRFNPYLTSELTGFTFKRYVFQELLYLRIFFTNLTIFASGIWLLRLLFRWINRRVTSTDTFMFGLFIYGIIHLIFFQNLVYIHDYMIYYLIPFVGISASMIIIKIFYLLPKNIRWLFLLVIIVTVSTERFPFIKALFASDMNKKGMSIGKFINDHTESGEITFVGSSFYNEFYNVFINFYSSRTVEYGENMPTSIDRYGLIVRPKAHDALNDRTKKYLDSNFLRQDNEDFIWYDLKR